MARFAQGQPKHVIDIPLPAQIAPRDLVRTSMALKDQLHDYAKGWLASRDTLREFEGTDLVIVFTDQAGQAILPDLDAAKSRAKDLAKVVTTNELAFTFNSSTYPWSATDLTNLVAQLNDYYPTAKAVYGSPAFGITVNLRRDPTISFAGLYYASVNEMVVQNNTDHIICHEMIHAFRDDDLVELMSFEEGMTRAAEIEVFDRLAKYTHPYENHNYTYDVYYEGLNREAIGSQSGSFFNTSPNTFFLLRYQLTGYAWAKPLLENANFFAAFNQQLYAAVVADPSAKRTESTLASIAASVQPSVEGKSFQTWYGQQCMLNTAPPQGYALYQRLNQYDVSHFYRNPSGAEIMQANATINWAIYNHQGLLLDSASAITGSYGYISFSPRLPTDYTGRIKIVATTTTPLGTLSNSVFRAANNEGGVFGVVEQANVGTVTITSLDTPTPPVVVSLINGSFSAPSLGTVRGRFRAVFSGTNGQSFTKQFNKDASDYFLLMNGGVDLAVSLSASPEPVDVGNNLLLKLSVTNLDSVGATGVILSNALPPNVNLINARPSQGTCSNIGGVLVCQLGSIASSSSATVNVTLAPVSVGLITNIARVVSNEPELNGENNLISLVSTVTARSISINDVSAKEGHTGTTPAIFTVKLSSASTQTVSVSFSTASGSALSGSDFLSTNGVLVFNPGQTNKTVTIQVLGNTSIETNEVFFVNLSSPTNAILGDSQGMGTIIDDDFSIILARVVGNDVRIRFATIAGRSYQLQRTDSLGGAAVWTTVAGAGNVSGTGGVIEVTDVGGAVQRYRFYRIQLLP